MEGLDRRWACYHDQSLCATSCSCPDLIPVVDAASPSCSVSVPELAGPAAHLLLEIVPQLRHFLHRPLLCLPVRCPQGLQLLDHGLVVARADPGDRPAGAHSTTASCAFCKRSMEKRRWSKRHEEARVGHRTRSMLEKAWLTRR
jgi:hypothetical protein